MIQKRIKRPNYIVDTEDCTGIQDIYSLQKHLENLKSMYPSPYAKSVEPSKFHLYPYCSEETKIGGGFDVINKGAIETPVLRALQDTFECKIDLRGWMGRGLTLMKPSSNISRFFGIGKEFSVVESLKPDTEKFFDLLKNREKNMFVVSHSNFMSTFCKYIYDLFNDKIESRNLNESEKFDNLDIIQLQFVGETLKNMIIRRWGESYDIETKVSFGEHDEEESVEDTTMYTNKFIMRHCVACHNTQSGFVGKTQKVLNWMALHPEQGYLKYAICVSNTIEEMEEKGQALLSILEMNGGYENYEFGSSVVFRAVLTSIMQKRQLDILFAIKNDPHRHRESLLLPRRTREVTAAGGKKRGRKVKITKRKKNKKNQKTQKKRKTTTKKSRRRKKSSKNLRI